MSISAGMRQMLAIARSLLVKNPILFLDEPTVKLDAKGAKAVRNLIKKINEDYNITIILTTHYIFEAEELCDRVAIMDRGKIISCGSVDKLRNDLQRYDSVSIECSNINFSLLEVINAITGIVESSYSNSILKITSYKLENSILEIIKLLRLKNIDIYSIESNEPTLEEIFITTVKNNGGEK
jgi:ABC-2 type transport system ATP-binding protein